MTRTLVTTSLVALAVCCLWSGAGIATVSQQVPIGPRAIGMADAFTAIADDATALFWNPAGLARIGHQEVSGSYANLFQSGIKDNWASFVLPLSVRQAAAVDWYHSGFDDGELGFGENRVDLGYGARLVPWLYAGGNAKFLTRNTSLDGATVRQGQGVGLDVGLLALPIERLRLGLVGQDVFDTRVDYRESGPQVAFPRHWRIGSAWSFGRLATLAFDLDDRWHLGLEAWPLEQVALRGGAADDRHGYERGEWTYGVGFKAGVLRLDYARVEHPTLDATDHFSLAMEFNFNPAQVRIERVEARDLYSSLYKTYAREGFGTVQLRNLQDRPLLTKLSIMVPGMMTAPSEQEILLRPKAVQEIPLTAVFTERALAQSGDRPVQVAVSASYQSRRLARKEKGAARCVAYGPGAINWGNGVEQAAAFVTLSDPAVDELAREVSRTVALQERDPFGNRNLSYAAALTDALAALGVAYVPDPNNPYSAISETPHAVDTIHYPYETLEKRVGDCDDTTVLMAALLGNVGVATRFIDAPGHLFLLVDTGVHARNRLALAVDDALTVVADDEVWIPLETTALSKGFMEAWKTGAESYASWAARGRVALVDVTEAQARYEPAVPGGARKPLALDAGALRARLEHDAQAFAAARSEYLATRYGAVEQGLVVGAAGLDQVARVYFLAGRLAEARARLEQALGQEPQSPRAHNNLGVVLFGLGDGEGALRHFESALSVESGDPGVWLNLGVARYALGDTAGAEEPLAEGVSRCGGYDAACRLLGLGAGEPAARGETRRTTAEEIRQLIRAALLKVPAADSLRMSARGRPGAAKPAAPAKPIKTRVAATRSAPPIDVQGFLYWKEEGVER